MKTKIIITMLLTSAFMFGCKKENNQPNNGTGTSQSNTGTLYFQNTQIDPYTIYLDGTNMGVLAAGTTSSVYIVSTGISHTVKSQQASGYVLYPTVFTGSATLTPGGTATWKF